MRQNCVLLSMTCFFSSVLIGQEKHHYNPLIDVQHYEFNIDVNDSNNVIKAEAEITVLFLKAANAIEIDLIAKNDKGNGMIVTAVTDAGAKLTFQQTADKLKIPLRKMVAAGDSATFTISYGGTPVDGLVFSKNKFGQRTIFADNWPNRARFWLPCVDDLSDKASVDFTVTAPEHYKVISNGLLVEESALSAQQKFTHWRETVALPTKVMVIGLADFAVNNIGNVDCIPVSSWVFPADKKNGFYDYAQAMEILPFFINSIGPYAYKKLANVEAITIFGGMENASAIFYNERSINGKRTTSEELMAHEIAHQWFGNSATESGWPHVWLSEGFATEMANLYLENKYGADTLKARLKASRATIINFEKTRYTPVVDSSEKENFLALLNSNSYEKGGWVLHMLRRKLGDTLFFKGIRAYYAAYAGKNASTEDLQLEMEKASGIGLKQFFTQWLYKPGHPTLQLSWKYDEKKRSVTVHILQQQKELFSFPLEFAFVNTAPQKTTYHTVIVKDKITQIEIPIKDRPLQVIADPSVNLLFEGSMLEEKTP